MGKLTNLRFWIKKFELKYANNAMKNNRKIFCILVRLDEGFEFRSVDYEAKS